MKPKGSQRAGCLAFAALAAGALLAPGPLVGQSPDEQAVLAVVDGMFEAMRAKDAVALQGLFLEGARLVSTSDSPEGTPRSRASDMTDFAQNIAGATVMIDEQIWDPKVELHDNLAHVWVKYALFIDGEFSHCGVDSFQLFRSTEGWKIFHLADTQRRQDCWMPPG